LGKGKGKEATAASASASDIPPILRDKPWRARKNAYRQADEVVLDLPLLGLDRETVKLVRPARVERVATRCQTPEENVLWKADVENGRWRGHADAEIEYAPLGYITVPDDDGLWAWNEKRASLRRDAVAWVEKHCLNVLLGFDFTHRDWIQNLK